MKRWIIATITAATLNAPLHADDPVVKAWLSGDLNEARGLLEQEEKSGGISQSRRLLLARVCFRQAQYERAADVLTELLREDVDHPQGRELLGRVLFRQGQPDDAISYYEDALKTRDDVDLRFEYAECLQRIGRTREAVKQLSKLVDSPAPPIEAYYALGKLRLQDGTGRWASRYLWAAHKSGSTSPDLPWLLAQSFFMEGKVLGPLKVEANPEGRKPGYQDREGTVVRIGERDGRAVRYISAPDTAIHQLLRYPDSTAADPDRQEMLAACWIEAVQYDKAGEVLRTISAERLRAQELRARLALAIGDTARVSALLSDWPVITRREDRITRLRLILEAALLAESQERDRVALELLEQANELSPGREDVLQRLVRLTHSMGLAERAEQFVHELLERYPATQLTGELSGLADVNQIRMRGESGVLFK